MSGESTCLRVICIWVSYQEKRDCTEASKKMKHVLDRVIRTGAWKGIHDGNANIRSA